MALKFDQKMTLSIILFLILVIVPFFVFSFMTVSASRDALVQDRFGQLISVRELKKSQIEHFFAERRGDMAALVQAVGTLRKEAFDKLTAVREVKREAVERCFSIINDQIITFSENNMVVDAMLKFNESFFTFREENNVSPDRLQSMRRKLDSYYRSEFTEEFKKQNDGEAPEIVTHLKGLSDDSIALQFYYIHANKYPLGSKYLLDKADDASRYTLVHSEAHPIFRSYLDRFGYYDIFLVAPDSGTVVYSVFKEVDFGTSLKDGPYAGTNLGEAFRRANRSATKDSVILVDYETYLPSYGAPAGFIASPIFQGDKKIGIAIFQMPIDRFNVIMGERSGLGNTGETYLVGPDRLMRSDSYLDPEKHSVVASFKYKDTGKVETDASEAALTGRTGARVIIDYLGNPVLSAYTPVRIGELTWGLLAEIDVAEAFCPVDHNGNEFFLKYREIYGYYDLFLLNHDGFCFYTAAKESDYQTNFLYGKFKDSNLGKLVRQVMNSKRYGIADFESYPPSNNEPAAFIAQPVVHEEKVEAVVALQLSIDAINDIMKERTGLGRTGETYLIGTDKLMRSDSHLDPIRRSVRGSFKNPERGRVDTETGNAALSGETGEKIVMNYGGNPVLSAYTPMMIGDATWALLVEIDVEEVVTASPAAQKLLLQTWKIGIVFISFVLVGVVLLSVFIIKSLSGSSYWMTLPRHGKTDESVPLPNRQHASNHKDERKA